MSGYRHTQKSKWLVGILCLYAFIMLGVATSLNDPPFWAASFALLVLVGAIAWLFSSLTVDICETDLKWFFGPGFWRKTIARADIVGAERARLKWWYGWGIRFTPQGWLYNVHGLDAVAVEQRNGKRILIGTDEPDAVVTALGFS